MVWISILLLLSSFIVGGKSAAQKECKVSTYGTEFVFGFLDLPYYASSNNQASDPNLSVILTLRGGTNIYVTIFSTGSASKTPIAETKKYYIHQFQELSFNSSFINKYQDTSSGGIIKIKSEDPIAVMTKYEMSSFQIVNPILPINALSNSYQIPSYTPNTISKSRSQFLVISLNDSTEVRFEGFETGNMVYPLSKEEIFIYERQKDLSSTSTSSNFPFALFSSVMAGNHLSYGKVNAYLSMQVPPMDRHANHFIVPPLDGDSVKYYKVRIYASVQNAFIEIHSSADRTQQVHVYHKIFYELTTTSMNFLEILSDNPLVVVQIALGSSKNALFMTNIPATSQFLHSYSTTGLDGRLWHTSNTFVITIPFSEASGLLIDRKPVTHDPSQISRQTPLGNFTVLTIGASASVSTVTHVNSVPFGLLVVGQWNYNNVNSASGFQAGMQFTTDCQLSSPQTDISGSFVG